MLLQTMAIKYLQTLANTEITFKVSAVSLARASTNIQPVQGGPGKTTGPWMVSKPPSNLCRAHGLNGLGRQDLSQQMCSPIIPSHVLDKSHNFYCIFVPWYNGENSSILRLVTTHWTKHSRLQTPHGCIQELSSIQILQQSSEEAPRGISVPVSGFIWRCQISSSSPVYLLTHWAPY